MTSSRLLHPANVWDVLEVVQSRWNNKAEASRDTVSTALLDDFDIWWQLSTHQYTSLHIICSEKKTCTWSLRAWHVLYSTLWDLTTHQYTSLHITTHHYTWVHITPVHSNVVKTCTWSLRAWLFLFDSVKPTSHHCLHVLDYKAPV